jgi:tetrahydrodipicolinate N-succinyltransferase
MVGDGVALGVQVAVASGWPVLVGSSVQVGLVVGARTVLVTVGSEKRVAVGFTADWATARGAVTPRINAEMQATNVSASITAVTML